MVQFAKYQFSFFLLVGLAAVTLLVNSCKKDPNDSVAYFLTNGPWTLASVQVFHYIGDTQTKTDTLNTNCGLDQKLVFNSDNTCTYQNYHCIAQSSAGNWTFDPDNLTIATTLAAQDTSKGTKVNVTALGNAQVINLGQYSLVLQTGDIQASYKATTVRNITRYGFVHAVK